jgi:type I restriction enzyme S subunit
MKKYTAYKDSGVEWIGEIPETWKVKSLKYACDLKSGDNLNSVDLIDEGKYPVYGGNGLRGYYNEYTHDGFYALIGRQGALCGNINYGNGKFWATEHAVVATILDKSNTQYLGELLRTMNLNQYSVSAAQPGLSVETIKNLRIPSPPIEEQTAIALYLDHKTAQIDTLLRQSEKIIALLQEQRTAIINQAVTKGLTHLPPAQGGTLGVPLKDSGVEWIGELPEHWDRTYLKRISKRVVVGIAEAATQAYADDGVPILRATNIKQGEIKGDIFYINKEFAQKNNSKKLWANDLVTVRTGYPGQTAVVPESLDGCQCFTMLITTMKDDCNPHFYSYFINSGVNKTYLEITAWGSAQLNISVPILEETWVPKLSYSEQTAIVNYLDQKTAEIATLIQKEEQRMALLKEYRASLISEVVTGKVMVF